MIDHIKTISGVERDGERSQFVISRKIKPECIYESMDQMIAGTATCVRHHGPCSRLAKGPVDLLVMGPPCKPYSTKRSRENCATSDHPDFNGLWVSGLNVIDATKPHGGILEEVGGFEHCSDGPGSETWCQKFVRALRCRGYHVITASIDTALLSDAVRYRTRKHIIETIVIEGSGR